MYGYALSGSAYRIKNRKECMTIYGKSCDHRVWM